MENDFVYKTNRDKFFIILTLLLFIFSFTRVYRNSFGYYNTTVGGIWNVIVIVFCLLSFYVLLTNSFKSFTIKENSTKYILFYGFTSFAFCLSSIEFSLSGIYNLFMILAFPLSFYLFYYSSLDININKISKLFVVLYYILLVLITVSNVFRLTGRLSYIMISNIYYLMCLFPLVLYLCKKKNLIILLTFVPVITSEKRTAFIAFFAAVALYFLIKMYNEINFIKTVDYLVVALLLLVVLFIILFFLEKKYGVKIISRLLNLSKDKGSGRGVMYKTMLDAFKKSSIFSKIIGHGMGSTQRVLVVHDDVHNDFIQILYEYGIVPLFSFILFYLSLIKKCIRITINKSIYAVYIFPMIAISLCLSLFSIYLIDYTFSICAAFSLGMLLSLENQKNYKGESNGF